MTEGLRIGTEVALSRNVICREKVVGAFTLFPRRSLLRFKEIRVVACVGRPNQVHTIPNSEKLLTILNKSFRGMCITMQNMVCKYT